MLKRNRFSILLFLPVLLLTLSGCYYTAGYSSNPQYRTYHYHWISTPYHDRTHHYKPYKFKDPYYRYHQRPIRHPYHHQNNRYYRR